MPTPTENRTILCVMLAALAKLRSYQMMAFVGGGGGYGTEIWKPMDQNDRDELERLSKWWESLGDNRQKHILKIADRLADEHIYPYTKAFFEGATLDG